MTNILNKYREQILFAKNHGLRIPDEFTEASGLMELSARAVITPVTGRVGFKAGLGRTDTGQFTLGRTFTGEAAGKPTAIVDVIAREDTLAQALVGPTTGQGVVRLVGYYITATPTGADSVNGGRVMAGLCEADGTNAAGAYTTWASMEDDLERATMHAAKLNVQVSALPNRNTLAYRGVSVAQMSTKLKMPAIIFNGMDNANAVEFSVRALYQFIPDGLIPGGMTVPPRVQGWNDFTASLSDPSTVIARTWNGQSASGSSARVISNPLDKRSTAPKRSLARNIAREYSRAIDATSRVVEELVPGPYKAIPRAARKTYIAKAIKRYGK